MPSGEIANRLVVYQHRAESKMCGVNPTSDSRLSAAPSGSAGQTQPGQMMSRIPSKGQERETYERSTPWYCVSKRRWALARCEEGTSCRCLFQDLSGMPRSRTTEMAAPLPVSLGIASSEQPCGRREAKGRP